jgi:hypothetical protein
MVSPILTVAICSGILCFFILSKFTSHFERIFINITSASPCSMPSISLLVVILFTHSYFEQFLEEELWEEDNTFHCWVVRHPSRAVEFSTSFTYLGTHSQHSVGILYHRFMIRNYLRLSRLL